MTNQPIGKKYKLFYGKSQLVVHLFATGLILNEFNSYHLFDMFHVIVNHFPDKGWISSYSF